jgi:hypothetical protein
MVPPHHELSEVLWPRPGAGACIAPFTGPGSPLSESGRGPGASNSRPILRAQPLKPDALLPELAGPGRCFRLASIDFSWRRGNSAERYGAGAEMHLQFDIKNRSEQLILRHGTREAPASSIAPSHLLMPSPQFTSTTPTFYCAWNYCANKALRNAPLTPAVVGEPSGSEIVGGHMAPRLRAMPYDNFVRVGVNYGRATTFSCRSVALPYSCRGCCDAEVARPVLRGE